MILAENARLRLRMMRREDADELYALLSDEAVMRWLEPRENFSATPSTTTMTSTAGSSAGCSSLPFGTRAMRTK